MSDQRPAGADGVPAGLRPGFVAASGTVIAGYRIERQIGQGGMATVFVARDERLRRQVALKILAQTQAADAAFRQRFLKESLTAAAVDDPHIIPVYEAGEAEGILFIAMRYVPGGDVHTLLRSEEPLAMERVAAIISPIASALDAAHEAGLVHRDVKPANMLIDIRPGRPDHLYLSDFGLSKGAMSAAGLTGAGEFLGTPDYCAPEQIDGRVVSGQTDQYALACTAFELLTGEPPFRRDLGLAVIYSHLSEPPPPASQRRAEVPAAVDEVLARALAKAPADRYPTCREFADELRAALGLSPYAPARQASPQAIQPAEPQTETLADPQAERPADPSVDPAAAIVLLPQRTPTVDAPIASALAGHETEGPARRRQTIPRGDRVDPGAPVGHASDSVAERAPEHEPRAIRRRLRVVGSVLALAVLLIGGGALIANQVINSQYYVGTSDGKVVIFRGLDQTLLGISLSSVYRRTDIPASGITLTSAQAIKHVGAGSLAQAARFVANIRKGYEGCQSAYAAVRFWQAHKPKPRVIRVKVHGRTVIKRVAPRYRPKPPIPGDCPPSPPSTATR